jgi:hypothetical protein
MGLSDPHMDRLSLLYSRYTTLPRLTFGRLPASDKEIKWGWVVLFLRYWRWSILLYLSIY